jgi:AraC family transcriptional regulator
MRSQASGRQAGGVPDVKWGQIGSGLRVGLIDGMPRADVRMPAEHGRHVSLALMLEGSGHYRMDGATRVCPYASGCCYLSCAWERFSGADYFPAYHGLKVAILQYRTDWLDLFASPLRDRRVSTELYPHPLRRACVMRMQMSSELLQLTRDLLEEGLPACPLDLLKVESKALAALWQVAHLLKSGEAGRCAIASEAASARSLTGRERRLLLDARSHIERHCLEPLDVAGIGRAVGLGHNALKQGFRALFGKSVYGYVLDCRLEHALKLLDESTLPIKEIAWRCGFAHASHLARHFRRCYAVSPRAYRSR